MYPKWQFPDERDMLISRLECALRMILGFLNFATLREFYISNHFNFALLSGRTLEVGTLQTMGKNRGRSEHVQIHLLTYMTFFTYFQEVPFNTTFYKSPIVILSVNHEYNLKAKGSRPPENNIISSWVEVGLNFYSNLRKKPAFHATPPLIFPQNDV